MLEQGNGETVTSYLGKMRGVCATGRAGSEAMEVGGTRRWVRKGDSQQESRVCRNLLSSSYPCEIQWGTCFQSWDLPHSSSQEALLTILGFFSFFRF
jgi:hypothetical protein